MGFVRRTPALWILALVLCPVALAGQLSGVWRCLDEQICGMCQGQTSLDECQSEPTECQTCCTLQTAELTAFKSEPASWSPKFHETEHEVLIASRLIQLARTCVKGVRHRVSSCDSVQMTVPRRTGARSPPLSR